MPSRTYIAIDLKPFYTSAECVTGKERNELRQLPRQPL